MSYMVVTLSSYPVSVTYPLKLRRLMGEDMNSIKNVNQKL
jgi:hypothetical protein